MSFSKDNDRLVKPPQGMPLFLGRLQLFLLESKGTDPILQVFFPFRKPLCLLSCFSEQIHEAREVSWRGELTRRRDIAECHRWISFGGDARYFETSFFTVMMVMISSLSLISILSMSLNPR